MDQLQFTEEELRQLLAGHKDILSPAMKEPVARTCTCGANMVPVVDPARPFEAGNLLPRMANFCPICDKIVNADGQVIRNPAPNSE